jgi:hypothetical protein
MSNEDCIFWQLWKFCDHQGATQTKHEMKTLYLELRAKLKRISLEEPELQAKIETKLSRGPELAQLLPFAGQLAQRALHRAEGSWDKD